MLKLETAFVTESASFEETRTLSWPGLYQNQKHKILKRERERKIKKIKKSKGEALLPTRMSKGIKNPDYEQEKEKATKVEST